MYPVVCTLAATNRSWEHISSASSFPLPWAEYFSYASAARLTTLAAAHSHALSIMSREVISSWEEEAGQLEVRIAGSWLR